MAQPPKYLKLANFAQLGAVPPVALDTELVNIANSVNASATNLGLIQRDDGALKDGLVTIAALSAPALLSLAGAANQAVVDSATASATSATASANAIATRDAAMTAETNARIAADTAEIARANAVYLPLAGNAAQVVSVAAPTANGHAVRIVGYANFSVSAGVLTVHKQVGMTLTRSAAGTFLFTFAVAQPDANWTCAINHVRLSTWVNSGEYVFSKTASGATLVFVENIVATDPTATLTNASSIIIFAA